MMEREHRPTPASSPVGFVYFFRRGADGPIKIGYTTATIASRLTSVQTATPDCEIVYMGALRCSCPESVEQLVHIRFHHLRLRGEWFQPDRDLLDFIAKEAKPEPVNAPARITPRAGSEGVTRRKTQMIGGDLVRLIDLKAKLNRISQRPRRISLPTFLRMFRVPVAHSTVTCWLRDDPFPGVFQTSTGYWFVRPAEAEAFLKALYVRIL